MNIWVGVLKVNSVSSAASVNMGTNFIINPVSNTKSQVGTATYGDGSTVTSYNPIYDPDGVDNPSTLARL